MSSLIEKLKQLRPNVKDSTIRSYAKQLKKVNDGKDITNFKFLNNTGDILSRLAQKKDDGSFKYSPSAQKLMLASILVAIKGNEKMSKQYDVYLKKAQDMSKAYYNGLAENRKTQRQSDNCRDQNELSNGPSVQLKVGALLPAPCLPKSQGDGAGLFWEGCQSC